MRGATELHLFGAHPTAYCFFLFEAILFYVNNFFPADTSISCVMRCNLHALQNEVFKTVGQMLATIIIQGGEHPRIFFSRHMLLY